MTAGSGAPPIGVVIIPPAEAPVPMPSDELPPADIEVALSPLSDEPHPIRTSVNTLMPVIKYVRSAFIRATLSQFVLFEIQDFAFVVSILRPENIECACNTSGHTLNIFR